MFLISISRNWITWIKKNIPGGTLWKILQPKLRKAGGRQSSVRYCESVFSKPSQNLWLLLQQSFWEPSLGQKFFAALPRDICHPGSSIVSCERSRSSIWKRSSVLYSYWTGVISFSRKMLSTVINLSSLAEFYYFLQKRRSLLSDQLIRMNIPSVSAWIVTTETLRKLIRSLSSR